MQYAISTPPCIVINQTPFVYWPTQSDLSFGWAVELLFFVYEGIGYRTSYAFCFRWIGLCNTKKMRRHRFFVSVVEGLGG